MYGIKRVVLLLFFLSVTLRPALAVDSVVVFNEIHYHPVSDEALNEWVELHNQMAIDIDLSEWSLEGAVDFTFAEGTIIPGGGYLVIAANPTALQAAKGIGNVVGPFSGRLNNGSGQLELRDRNDRLMDKIEYRDGGKWPVAPDGSGATLAKRDPNLPSGAPENWTSSVLVDGTPGIRNFPAPDNSYRRSLVPLNALWRYEASGTDLGTAWREPGFDHSSWAGRNAAILLSYWSFDGDATATRGTSGTLMNGVTASADRNGVANGALAFNGTSSQWVSVPGGGGLNAAAQGTISMWVKWTGASQDPDCCGSFGAVLARQSNGQFSDCILALNNANPLAARIVWRQSGGPAPVLITGSTVAGTNWHHIVVTFANGGSTLYVDGVAEGTAVGSGMNNNPATPLSIGAWAPDGAGFSTASIDDVAIWDRPLSAGQVAELAAQTKTPLDFVTPETALYYAGDGRLPAFPEFRQTTVPLGANTYYFRNVFQYSGYAGSVRLELDVAVDDGAIFYLNGAEVYRQNMPAGPVSYSTFAATAIGDAAIVHGISIPANLLPGSNALAVEVHQAGPADAGMIFGAALTAVVTPPPPVETRSLIALSDAWKFNASDTDPGTPWRDSEYNDAAWSSGAGVLYAGSGRIDGIPPEQVMGVSATASSQYPDGRLAVNTVNGSGLTGNAHANTPPTTMWLNNGTLAAPNDLNPFISFDLGALYNVRFMKVWNYNELNVTARGVALADILLAGTNGSFTSFISGQAFTQAPGTATDFSQTFDLGGTAARYVRLEKLTNFPGGDNRFVGLSEVQFFRDVELRRTGVPLGTTTYYFRKSFYFGGDPALAQLILNTVFDDGAVFYLNGVEIHRANMGAGAVTHGTVASVAVGNARFTGPLTLSNAPLQFGVNVLAAEVHQSTAGSDPDMVFGAELTARVAAPPPEAFDAGGLVFNEISAASDTAFQIELINRGIQPLNTDGYVLVRRGGPIDMEYDLPSQTIAPGGFLAIDSNMMGFGAAPGDKLFLVLPGGRGIADGLEVHERARARAPDATGEWLTPSQSTIGANNVFQLSSNVVINEIFYNGPPILPEPSVISSNVPIISYTNEWRYEQSGTDLGTAWRQPNYDDSLWPVGRGLFYVTTATLPAPKNTPLTLGPITYYFRTTLVNTGSPAILSMALRHIMDDGIIVYLNGIEIHRFNMSGTVAYSTTANSAVSTIAQRGPLNIPPTSLITGTNVIAAEVHQFSDNGGDVVFGIEIRGNVETVPAIPFGRSPEGWVELYNRSSTQVDLTGWRMDEGIDFRFASNTLIPAGGYLVLAKNPADLLARFQGISVTGPYENALSRRGERLVLRDAADNAVNVVPYSDDGRWPERADGRGASLELRDPRADNAAGETWAASDERQRSSWQSYSYRGVAAASAVGPDNQWREFVIGLLDAGEVLLDDISVVETNATSPIQLIQNGSFTTGTNTWRIIGNHHGEVIDDPDQPGNKVLHLVATGAAEHMSNHGETTLANGRQVVNGNE
ncbi:MAG TPA: lamin tail domain-containing protein, partial [Candidatus Binatia bacterium]|nr:lamin tail domain-containing protein [Candidatus Binatia bacterium]